MPEQQVNIENLTIRIPRQFRDEAQKIAQDITQNLSINFSRQLKSNHYDSLNKRVTISNNTTRSQLTTLLTEAILKGLV